MPAELVFVHGIGGPRDAAAECRRWTDALADGARRAGHSAFAERLPQLPVRFAAYRDLFDPAGKDAPDVDLSPAATAILTGLLREVIDSHPLGASDDSTQWTLDEAREKLAGSARDRLVDAAATLMSIKSLRRSGQWPSGRLMLRDLAQVARYLARDEAGEPGTAGTPLDRRVRARVQDAIGAGATVVVAHSLGTVVALEALHEYAAEVSLFVTLGSPIGMRTVVWPRIVPQPPATPAGVRRWLNFWDRDDIIVARRDLEVRPNAGGVVPVGSRVDTDGVWLHTATKYLAQPGVAGPIAEALHGS